MREREIRYRMAGDQYVMPLSEDVSDESASEIAWRLTGLLYEREVTPWRHVLPTSKGPTA